jgi:hypothetical protein
MSFSITFFHYINRETLPESMVIHHFHHHLLPLPFLYSHPVSLDNRTCVKIWSPDIAQNNHNAQMPYSLTKLKNRFRMSLKKVKVVYKHLYTTFQVLSKVSKFQGLLEGISCGRSRVVGMSNPH